jgi:CRP-like cAMP-binding protein
MILGPADCFGEIALLEGTLRTATVHCVTDCRLGRLDKDAFTKLVLDRVGLLQIRQTLQAAAFLGRLTFLAGTSFPDLCEIAEHCRIPKKR